MTTPQFATLRDLFTYSTSKYKTNKALAYTSGTIYTYDDFRSITEKLSNILTKSGIESTNKVAILSQNMPNWPAAYFSITAFGRVVVPLLPDFSSHEINNILEHSETKALIVSSKLLYKISPEIISMMNVVIELDTLNIISQKEGLAEAEVIFPKNSDLASIIYTSGTTGNSKGVMLSHNNLCTHLYASYLLRPSFEWDVWLSILPLSHTLECSLCMMLPIMSGSSIYYLDKSPTPSVLLQALKIVKPTTILTVPLIIEKIYKGTILPKFNKSKVTKLIYNTTLGRKMLHRVAGKKLMETFGGNIRFFGIGGAKLDGIVERFLYEAKFPYAIGYGLTETCPLLAGAIPQNVKWQSTGPAIHGVTLRIDNPNPETGEGEIVAIGPNVMLGYYKNPEATEQAFTNDGWFRTKDLGIIDKDGRLYIKGRLSNMILGPSGENIYPEEIETVINAHELVVESLVTENKGKLVALVHFNPDTLKSLYDARDEAIKAYQEKRERLSKLYDEKVELLMKSYDETKEELLKTYQEKKDNTIKLYTEKKDEAVKAFNDKFEQIKKDVSDYVNARVNKFSKIHIIMDHPEQFEKTATHKIKRYLYTKKK